MARTQAVYELDAATGQSAIYYVDPVNTSDRSPMVNPNAFAKYISWHSALDFECVVYDRTFSIAFPSANGKPSYQKEWLLPAHNLGAIPAAMVIADGAMIIAGQPIQVQGTATRTLNLKVTATGVSLLESVSKWYEDPLAAITKSVRVIALDILKPGTNPDAFTIDCEKGIVSFDHGRFSNSGPDLIKAAKSGGTQFFIPKPGPSLDTANGGIKHVAPNGATVLFNGYQGAFNGSGGWPIKV